MSPAIIFRNTMFIGIALVLISCGGKSSDDAANAFENGNYKLAIQLYSESLQNDPANTHYKERIALCYMYRGLEFYNTTGNVKSFSGNFEKALEFIPEQTSQEFKQIYSDMLFRLSEVYISAKPQNEIEREDFLNKAITDLNEALGQNPGNHAADSLLIKIKMDNFEKMFEKGKKFYTEAEKTGKEELYFSAEYYLKEAAEFDVHNDNVKKLLSKTREKSLPLINVNDDIALAIGDYSYQNNQLIIDLRIQNFLTNPLQVVVANFELVGADGRIYTPDKETMAGKLKDKSIRNTTLDQKKTYTDGLLVFPVSRNVKLDYLTYKTDQTRVTKKYFP